MTDEMKSDGQQIRGVPYTVERRSKRPRYIVAGVMHPAGILPIRFKSLDRARRHMENMGIGKP